MLSHQDKCLFVHIPKAAGQSVESIFVQRSGLTWQTRDALLLRPNKEPEQGPPRLAHLTASEYTRLGYMSGDQFSQYFKFSFVRNPWARLVSEYNYRRMQGVDAYQKEFKHFLFKSFPQENDDNYLTSQDFYRHVIPQWKFLYDEDDNCLVDYVGKFEFLQQDFDKVCQLLGVPQYMLPHKNMTQVSRKGLVGFQDKVIKRIAIAFSVKSRSNLVKAHYSQYYDNESQAFVADKYRKDIELFDYQFDSI